MARFRIDLPPRRQPPQLARANEELNPAIAAAVQTAERLELGAKVTMYAVEGAAIFMTAGGAAIVGQFAKLAVSQGLRAAATFGLRKTLGVAANETFMRALGQGIDKMATAGAQWLGKNTRINKTAIRIGAAVVSFLSTAIVGHQAGKAARKAVRPPTPPQRPLPAPQSSPAPYIASPNRTRAMWEAHERTVTQAVQQKYPGKTVGTQVSLVVTNNTTGVTERIRIDNIVEISAGPPKVYQLIDAKWSGSKNLANPATDLTETLTESQRPVFDWIRTGQPITVVPVGERATRAGIDINIPITITGNVKITVNGPNGLVERLY